MIRPKLTRVIKKLCSDFKADYDKIDVKTRKKEVITVRHLIYYFIKEDTDLSWASIGSIFGQDHATALHGHKTIRNLLETNDKSLVNWYVFNEVQVRKMIDIALYGNKYLISKKYRHYEIVEMVARYFGETKATEFERFIINEINRQNEQ